MTTRTSSKGLLSAALVMLALGCASSSKAPTEQLAQTTASERAATEVGATGVPQAAYHMQLAREQTEHAQLLIKQHEYARANSLLERAQADAELALAVARAEQERAEAQSALDRVRALQRGY